MRNPIAEFYVLNYDSRRKNRWKMKGDGFITIPALDNSDSVLHVFTTRKSGLGARRSRAKSADDWLAVAEAFGIRPERLATVNQVHGDTIVKIDDKNCSASRLLEADGIITDAPGIAVGVETADCVPVLLYDPLRPAVAAVHAGWRSTVKKIVSMAVRIMTKEFGSEPGSMIAAIGPAICPECYEVDEPVMEHVRKTFSFWREISRPRGGDKWSLDLVRANMMELVDAGLKRENIHALGICTSCRTDMFYSFRAEGRTGRMLSVIMIKE